MVAVSAAATIGSALVTAGLRHTLRQAPLSGVDERPMKRASLAQLQQLLAEDEISAYESALPP